MVRLRFALWPIWCADMVYPIASSPTMAQILRKGRWPDMHLSKAFGLIWHQLHILNQMVKWKEQMALSCQASDPGWWSHSSEHPEHGLTSSQLFSLRTTPNRSTGFTPFFLVYGSEAIIPSDIEFDSPRHAIYTEEE